VLWVVGGRDDHERSRIEEGSRAAAEWREYADVIRRVFGDEFYERWTREVQQQQRSGDALGHRPTMAYPLGDPKALAEMLPAELRADMVPLEVTAPCRGCPRSPWVVMA
jgi:hypothetical protein